MSTSKSTASKTPSKSRPPKKQATPAPSRNKKLVEPIKVGYNEWAEPLFELDKLPRFTILHGGRGGGKDWAVSQAVIDTMRRRNLRVIVVRQFQSSMAITIKNLMERVIESCGWGDYFEITRTEIRYPKTNSVIHFEGAHLQVGAIKGWDGYDLCIVNEAQQIEPEAWRVLVPTIRKAGSKFILIMNPEFQRQIIAKEFLGPDLKGYDREDTLLIPVNWDDNLFLAKETREHAEWMRVANPIEYDHVYGGGYDRSALHAPFDALAMRDLELAPRFPDHGGNNLLGGVDFAASESAGSDFTVAIWGDTSGTLLGYTRFQDGDYRSQSVKLAASLDRCRRVLADSTGVGLPLVQSLREQCRGQPVVVPIHWSASEKKDLVGTLAAYIDGRRLKLAAGVDWDPLLEELRHYERKFTNEGVPTNRYSAAAGYNDDMVAALMMYTRALKLAIPGFAATAEAAYTVDGAIDVREDPEVAAPPSTGTFSIVGDRIFDARSPQGRKILAAGYTGRDWF